MQRIFLLKFLCDELLNSANIREHLERCASVSADLQQKLRSLSLEWRNLKFREEIVAGKVVRANGSVLGGTGKCGTGVATLHTHYGKLMRQPPSGSGYLSSLTSDLVFLDDGVQLYGANDFRKQPCWLYSKGISMTQPSCSENQIGMAPYNEFQVHQHSDKDNVLRTDSPQYDLLLSVCQSQKQDSSLECSTRSNRGLDSENSCKSGPVQPTCEVTQGHISSDRNKKHSAEHLHAMPMNPENIVPGHQSIVQHDMNESNAHELQGNGLKNEIAVLQDAIACLESELFTVSLRKELLGRDSAGRLYWAFFRPNTSPWLLVEGTTLLEQKIIEHGDSFTNNLTLGCSPFEREYNEISTASSWFSYQSDTEIEELIEWLTDSDPRDKELADSILRWQKIGYKDSNKGRNYVQGESLPGSSECTKNEATVNYNGLVTKALIVLEKKYGPCLATDASKISMKQGQNAELTCKERMYRCDCLEPVWPARFHCRRCHLSFFTRYELEVHNGGKCNSVASSSQSSMADDEARKGAGIMTETLLGEFTETVGKGMPGSLKHETFIGSFEISEELACPFDIEEISAKFVTKNSIKELVQEIGLIGSNGIPSFVPSTSPYLSDPTLKLIDLCENEVNRGDKSTNVENQLEYSVQGNKNSSLKPDNISSNSTGGFTFSHSDEEVLKCRRLNPHFMNEKRDQSFKYRNPKPKIGNCSTIREPSLRPLVGRSIQILRQLKINLLDMDAAVPEAALRSSKACWGKRCAWRAFVKSAKSIFEVCIFYFKNILFCVSCLIEMIKYLPINSF